MPDEPKPAPERRYQIGNVGPGARVAQRENISWIEGSRACRAASHLFVARFIRRDLSNNV